MTRKRKDVSSKWRDEREVRSYLEYRKCAMVLRTERDTKSGMRGGD